MKRLSSLLSLVSIIIFSSCERITGEGDLRTETRSTGNFTGVETQISGNVLYMQGSEYKVELTAQQNILNVMETPIINNKLVVRFRNNVRVRSHEQITVRVTAPSISSISSSGSGNVTVLSSLTSNNLFFNLTGSGNISLPAIATSHLEATISGSGNIYLSSGSATTTHFKIMGSGNIDAQNVPSKSAITNTSGSGTIRLNVSETLDVTISGSGSVFYVGNPLINTNISGSGRVIRL
jgi:hypothetical protein